MQHTRDVQPRTTRRGFFWVGIEKTEHPVGTTVRGSMYVEWEAPPQERHPWPIVLVHGGGGQGTDWLGTPDGRPGWAQLLVDEGYAVYVVDRPGHGRSPFHVDLLGEMGGPFSYQFADWLFVEPAEGPAASPYSHLHTEWIGNGTTDDPVLDQFMAGTGPMLRDFPAAHALEQSRLAELLDVIGPAIVVTHSAGGPVGWLVADARPQLVKALVAMEPMGPPFMSNPGLGVSLVWGLTASPITYDPPVSDPSELRTVTHDPPGPNQPPLTLQAEPARRLTNLGGIPIAFVTAEASPFVTFDEHAIAFLEQAGCDVDQVRLADAGVHGNGHGFIFERNHRETLQVILDWLGRRGLTA